MVESLLLKMKTSASILFLLTLFCSLNSIGQDSNTTVQSKMAPPYMFSPEKVYPELWECWCDDEASFEGGAAAMQTWFNH